ncbi:CHASE2 domain-containing protein [Scytonema sp. UIC 10036]|uniref:CHASE2 domain-containing protein n=1 Tax=Scytonema sp. UIC 10036 TaxID=2304196 RepID=UPI0012DA0615|nr:CHASE2 domain-containing protein [Scytonema sp. UIC 10036]MUG98118.1 CHASE2 domain-containing protein [Scytonema sp. UIC 10036]
MSKLVILKLGEGSFEQGFPVTLLLGEEGQQFPVQVTARLPQSTEIPRLYKKWRSAYSEIGKNTRKLEKPEMQVTNVSSREDCKLAAQELIDSFNDWLKSIEFLPVRDKLCQQLMPSNIVRFLLETEEIQLQRLPWHEWDFFADYPHAEIAISPSTFEKVEPGYNFSNKVKILAILGDSTGIDVKADGQILEKLPGANVKLLVEPQLQDINHQLWEEGWDILFFAGHSQTELTKGQIYLNTTDRLTVEELKFALKTAINRGLQIAIFNSCDGLGLAHDLADLHIPQIIVMREDVQDKVAQEFLKSFLKEFSLGESFYLAVRKARERLQGLEQIFPSASWLPVIYQNPAHIPPTWEDLGGKIQLEQEIVNPNNLSRLKNFPSSIKGNNQRKNRKKKFINILLASIFATGIIWGIRQMGMLQKLEIAAYDEFIQMRPTEKPDSRLLVVEATELDINKNKYGFPLPDGILAQAIGKLKQYQPVVIGLDIYREEPKKFGHAELVKQLRENNNVIAVCRVSDTRDPNNPGIEPPSGVPQERLGFADVVRDSDGVVRRHLLFLTPENNSPCQTDHAFSVRLALDYLATKHNIQPKPSPTGDLQLGNVVFQPLPVSGNVSGYHNIDGLGSQILLNYRSTGNVAEKVTLSRLLDGKIKPEAVQDRIVIIGVTGSTDFVNTPYREMPGVLLQAHKVSQILSAVLDKPKRSLLKTWSQEADILWIWGWSFVGGLLVWRSLQPLLLVVVIIAVNIALTGVCLILFINGYWVPLLPSIFALLLVSGGFVVYYGQNPKGWE